MSTYIQNSASVPTGYTLNTCEKLGVHLIFPMRWVTEAWQGERGKWLHAQDGNIVQKVLARVALLIVGIVVFPISLIGALFKEMGTCCNAKCPVMQQFKLEQTQAAKKIAPNEFTIFLSNQPKCLDNFNKIKKFSAPIEGSKNENEQYAQVFSQLNDITKQAILARPSRFPEAERSSYAVTPFDQSVDRYPDTLPFAYNTATYSGGRISGSFMSDASVAMAGPTAKGAGAVAHFMLEHRVPLIVRLTAFKQGERDKTFDWLNADTKTLGGIQSKRTESFLIDDLTDNYDGVYLNKEAYSLSKGVLTHSLKELYVEGWPDEDVVSPLAVINAVKALRKELEPLSLAPEQIPFVVHCSAGMGRTGVFYVAKKIMDELDAGRNPCIPEIILRYRLERNGTGVPFVMTAQQFKLCYTIEKLYRAEAPSQN